MNLRNMRVFMLMCPSARFPFFKYIHMTVEYDDRGEQPVS